MMSCSHTIQLQEGEFLLAEMDFKGNEAVYAEQLEDFIPIDQKPNNKPLNLPWVQFTPRVWFYNFGLNTFNRERQLTKRDTLIHTFEKYSDTFVDNKTQRKKQRLNKKIARVEENLSANNAWFWRNIGEPQAVMSTEKAKNTSLKLQKYLKDIGYQDAEVYYELDTLLNSNKVKLTYQVHEGTGYVIDTVQYVVEDVRLDSLIKEHRNEQLIAPGDLFDVNKVKLEKSRLELLAKQNGYYGFGIQYIQHEAYNANYSYEEFVKEKHGNLRFKVLNPQNQIEHNRYTVKEIVFKGFDPYSTDMRALPDTTVIKDVTYILLNKDMPEKILDKKVTSRPGELYDVSAIAETQRQIGLLNQFAFASSQISVLNKQELSLEYFAPQLPRYSFNTGPGINHVYSSGSDFWGFGIPATLTARNLLKRLELIDITGRVFREGQPSALGDNVVRGSWEVGTNLSVTFPSITLLGYEIPKLKLLNPRTQFAAGFNYSEPYWGNRLNFKLTNNYRWQPTRFTTMIFSLVDASLVNTNYNLNDKAGIDFYEKLIEQEAKGNNLKTTFDPQFVSSINGSYLYNNQNPQVPYGNSKFLRIYVESGGTLLNLSKNKNKIQIIENLFPLRSDFNSPDSLRKYFRFVKVNIDYRRYINLDPSSSLGYRFNIGVANPYGNKSLPYDKNFFIGGSNSVRAWSPRSLGTGSAKPESTVDYLIPQTGDILLEGSIEVRKKVARFFGDIQLATFIDVGNIWKWYQIDTEEKRDKANFAFNRFYKEIAVGTGAGIRYDLSYFQLRFDFGIKVMDPSRDEKDRFVLDEFKFKFNQPYGINFNLGVGYPF